MDFHIDGTVPKDSNTIWVFGSNLAGRHGRGAAKVAMNKFGAQYGVGLGLTGNSYAIPTKNKRIQTLNMESIRLYVNDFLDYARRTPEKKFFVTRIGCVLAGFADSQIAPMFKDAPDNCSFAEQWRPFLEAKEPTL